MCSEVCGSLLVLKDAAQAEAAWEAQAALLGEERLEGDNQYVCAFCEAKVDATRQLRLRSVPPYLCLSLQRFVFDLKARIHQLLLPRDCLPYMIHDSFHAKGTMWSS